MKYAMAAMMLAAASAGEGVTVHGRVLPRERRRPPKVLGPRKVACRRCGAAVGESCDPRTLGRYHYHRVRVDDAEARKRGGGEG